ncbi:hypothetical protein A2U01_0064036, partial [Trifolium medium]|nr:hypothetical protein [Trifolium medium]
MLNLSMARRAGACGARRNTLQVWLWPLVVARGAGLAAQGA